ncbi:MAG TPA: tRNA (adenosine(37)-N6)-threonylcarbamoyltransferase complex dimerization subunit type 1 TsaB [Burkholderiaceae bacterium]|nr:tRNA (adenosine(37)-N6)-threonylcarbamoyltransferase complex dimerization subunit type 1 TsaB [Burkholderiaceae bacterium]
MSDAAWPPEGAPDVRLLALDSSTERICIALQSAEHRVTRCETGGAQASARMVPCVLEVLREAGTGLHALDAVAFARGPGAFTGLRTACAVAQGLAYGAGKPVLPLDSLLLVADDAREQAGPQCQNGFEVWVAMDARMDEAYAGAYRFENGAWRIRLAPALYSLDALTQRWRSDPPAAIAGSALVSFGDRLVPGAARCWPHELDRAAALMRVARQAWAEGLAVDAALALPLYLRDKVALTTEERAVLRSGSGS